MSNLKKVKDRTQGRPLKKKKRSTFERWEKKEKEKKKAEEKSTFQGLAKEHV